MQFATPVAIMVDPGVTVVRVISAVLLLVLISSLVFLAERSLKRHRGDGLKRGRSERNAMSRIAVGLARWGGGGGGGGGS
jgi:hypothetical protein